MVRILNEIEEDTIQVMNHSDLGNSDHNNMGLDITIIVENAVQIPNGKSKNHNNNNNSNNNSIATSPVGTADNGSYSNTNDTPDPDPDDEKNPENQLNSPSPKSMTNQTTKHKKCTEDLENPIEITTENEEIKIPTPSTHTNKNGLQKPSKGEDKPIESKKETVEAKEQKETDNCTVHGIKDNHRTPVIIVENVDEDCTSKTVVEPETSIELEEKSGTPKDNSDEPKATEQTPDDKKTGKSESGSKTDGKTPISEEPTVSKPKEAEGKTTGAGASTEPAKKDVNSSGGSVNKGRNLHHHHHHHHAHHNPHNHFKHLPNQHGHILPHLHQANAQHLLPGLLPTLGLHMPQPIDGRCLFGNLDGISQAQNLQFSVGGHPPPLHFNFFGEPKYESMNCPWNQFPPQPSVASSVPPHGGLASPQIPTAPLPTALFPLPLDPACPPAVLPSHPVVSNSSSGFSTAGHSRSSSPMAASTQAQGQTLMTAEPVTSCLPPANALLPNPTVPAGSPGHINPAVASANPNVVFSASSSEIALYPHFPVVPGQYVVFFHINPGVLVSFNVGGDHIQIIKGPMTVPLVSTNSNPPIPLPMQVPQGHVVQQIVDENGTLRHVIVSHQPPLMPIPFGPGSQSQPFYPPGPGFPGHFPGMQAGVPCGVPSTQGPPTPPGPNSLNAGAYVGHLPAHAHKDERAQRQYVKLRRKFELKQQRDREMTSLTPSFYHQNGGSRKAESGGYNNNNSQRRNVPNGTLKSPNGGIVEEDGSVGSTGSVTSTGTQDEEEESRIQAQTEMLSTLIPPVVSEVASQSALIQWSHPDRFTESGENRFPELDVSDTDFQYDVYIMDKTRDSRFKSIFTGSALSCRVKDLKPGTIYAISYCALLNDMKGSMSVATNFTTLPDVPDPPSSLRAVSRSRSSIQFKWNPVANPNDNGAKVTSYVLEYDEGKGGSNYVEAYRGKNKQCTVSKLQPAYSYQFRVAAVNQCGQSRYSSTVQVMTAGSPPSQPAPPTLTEAGGTYLTLEWKCRPTDDEYTLQMEDPSTGHGFLCVYNGNAPHYTCIALRRNTQYKFRVKAQNEEGHSKWSEEVTLKTLPGQPGPPHKPCLKGRVHSNSFKVRWDPPSEDGGVPISAYALEIDQGNGGFEEIYRGSEAEFNIDKLSPGQSYALRVIAVGPGGESVPSESCVITTEPVCPGKCNIPRIVGKPKSNSVHLRWNPPDWDGGSPVNQYEVGCTTPDNLTQEAYRGKETDCFVNRLLPGRAYLFQIRAFNRIGAGPWSDPLEVVSGAGAPDVPAPVQVHTKTAHMVILSWAEPLNNGSAVTEYRVQMATVAVESPEEESSSSAVDNSPVEQSAESTPIVHTPTVAPTPAPTATSSFCQVFLGPALSCEVKSLQPATVYLFRVQATNSAGSSDWSPVTTHQMPASSPNAVSSVEATASSDSISLCWVPPSSNGACILQYNVSIGEAIFVTTTNSYVVDNLMADTHYKIRVQAVNGVGPGPYSSVIKISTKPLPPQPPKLECVSTAHFWMKLKWNETSSKNIEYLIQMISPYQDEFQVVYRGSNPYCKVTRLAEDTQYKFRVCALNGAGQGPFSDMYHFSTLKAPPPQVKGLKVEVMLEAELCRLEWSPVACADTTAYQLQLAKLRDQEFKTIFRGEERKYEMDAKELEEGVEYTARVCAIRQCDDSSQLVGPYSNAVSFTVQQPQMLDSNSSKRNSTPFSKNLSSASPLRSNFLNVIEEKLGNISFESRVGIVAVFALIILAFVISLITHHVVS